MWASWDTPRGRCANVVESWPDPQAGVMGSVPAPSWESRPGARALSATDKWRGLVTLLLQTFDFLAVKYRYVLFHSCGKVQMRGCV